LLDEAAAFECDLANVKAVVADKSETNMAMWVLVKNRCAFGGVLDGSGLK